MTDREIEELRAEKERWATGYMELLSALDPNIASHEKALAIIASLKNSALVLDALEAMGVDNWEGYDEAMRDYYGDSE